MVRSCPISTEDMLTGNGKAGAEMDLRSSKTLSARRFHTENTLPLVLNIVQLYDSALALYCLSYAKESPCIIQKAYIKNKAKDFFEPLIIFKIMFEGSFKLSSFIVFPLLCCS